MGILAFTLYSFLSAAVTVETSPASDELTGIAHVFDRPHELVDAAHQDGKVILENFFRVAGLHAPSE